MRDEKNCSLRQREGKMSGPSNHPRGRGAHQDVRSDPPIHRLAKRLLGPNANGEPLALLIVSAPLFVLASWLSVSEPLTVTGTLASIYVASVVFASLVTQQSVRMSSKNARKYALGVIVGLSLFLVWIPSLLNGTFLPDLLYAGVALFGAILIWSVLEFVTTRILLCGECETVRKFRWRREDWRCTECGTLLPTSRR